VVGTRMDRVDQYVQFGSVGRLRLSAAASTVESSPARIDFTFDLAYFESPSLPFRIPYPVRRPTCDAKVANRNSKVLVLMFGTARQRMVLE
jgi:hypothetical protein